MNYHYVECTTDSVVPDYSHTTHLKRGSNRTPSPRKRRKAERRQRKRSRR